MPLHRKTVALNRTSTLSCAIIWQQFGNSTEPYSIFGSHEYFLASISVPIVKAAKAFNPGELKITDFDFHIFRLANGYFLYI